MTKHLAENFVDLSNRGFRPNRSPEFALYHGEGGFHVRPLVIVAKERISVEVVEVPHTIPEAVKFMVVIPHASRIRLERNVGYTALCLNGMKISAVRVSLVSRHFIDRESLGSCVDQSGKLDIVSRFVRCGFYTGNDMGSNPAHKVSLNPSLLAFHLTVFVVEPSGASSGGEARGTKRDSRWKPKCWCGGQIMSMRR